MSLVLELAPHGAIWGDVIGVLPRESLHRFLVDTDYDCIFGRLQVQVADLLCLHGKVGVAALEPLAYSVRANRLEPQSTPHLTDAKSEVRALE